MHLGSPATIIAAAIGIIVLVVMVMVDEYLQ